jgi:hypothetical protein
MPQTELALNRKDNTTCSPKHPSSFRPASSGLSATRKGGGFVALYWEPSGDEACYDEGVSYACGTSDNWLYLDFTRRPEVRRWLDERGLDLGNSDEPATHWLIADALTGDLYAAPRREALAIVRQQKPPAEGHTA